MQEFHVEQAAKEKSARSFWSKYLREYRKNRDAGQSADEAYWNNPFEREARDRADRIEKALREQFPDDPSCG